jgi:protoheme IX farnesyltransferase
MSVTVIARPKPRRLALAYVELTKPRIASLVIITGVPALLLAKPGWPGASVFFGTLLGTALAAMSAASFNHYFDRDIDGLMRRTASRPLPSGVLPPSHALGLGFALAALSWGTLVAFANPLAAWIGQFSIFYYAVIYTVWLKRRTPQNIVICGGAGASAPIIAWAAVTGTVELPALLLAGIVFLWTPPHFWSLALYRHDDYERANIPMLPVTPGLAETRRHIVAYSFVLVPITLLLGPIGTVGLVYMVPAAVLGAVFIGLALRLQRSASYAHAIALFRFSILYLFLLFALLTVDASLQAWIGGPFL